MGAGSLFALRISGLAAKLEFDERFEVLIFLINSEKKLSRGGI